MTKGELRKIYLEKRLSLSEAEYERLNLSIRKNFFDNIDLTGITILHTFLPLEKNREPNTWLIIDQIKKHFPAIRISIPRVNTQTTTLENFFYVSSEQVMKNFWGIPEPQYGTPTPSEEVQVVLVPMLVCDQHGHRVGYGKGFYDRFLSTCSPNCVTVGICFFEPINKIDDVNAFDVRLHYCVTPFKVHNFKQMAPVG
jgi:5-formyltetrahydrofolate cyclo-ligase